jgi:hypothetical protein
MLTPQMNNAHQLSRLELIRESKFSDGPATRVQIRVINSRDAKDPDAVYSQSTPEGTCAT